MQSADRFVLFDGHALIYRAYHAIPPLTDPKGRMVNAVYGFSRILLTTIQDLGARHLAVAFDHKAKTKRAESFAAYKANRPEMPEDLRSQIDIIKEVVQALNIPQFSEAGIEADDLIGTISLQLSKQADENDEGFLTTIVTGDKDMFQLVDSHVHVIIPGRGAKEGLVEFDSEGVMRKMGVLPSQIIDLKGLMGDASDNIPGVPGVGPKTATALLQQYSTLENLYSAVAEVSVNGSHSSHPLLKGAVVKRLIEGKESAFMSKALAAIDRSIAIDFDIQDCILSSYDKEAATKILSDLQFTSILPLLPKDAFELEVQSALF